MSGNNFQDPLDPPNSPIEKLITQRRFKSERRFRDYLQAQGIEPDMADRIGAAMDRWEEDKDFEWQEEIRELESWANIHTHGGVIGGVVSPHKNPPLRILKSQGADNFMYYSADNGYTWSQGTTGMQYAGPHMEYLPGYVVRPIVFRYTIDVWDDNGVYHDDGTPGVNLTGSTGNSEDLTGIAVDPENELGVIVGGDFQSPPVAFYSYGPNYHEAAGWTQVAPGGNERLLDVCFNPATGRFTAVGGTANTLFRSDEDDPTTWTQLSAVLPFACDRIESFKGDLFASEWNGNRIVKSSDGGSTWSTVLTLGSGQWTEYIYTNGVVLLFCTTEGLYRSDDGLTFSLVTSLSGSSTQHFTSISWDGVSWLVVNSDGEVWLTENDAAEANWQSVFSRTGTFSVI